MVAAANREIQARFRVTIDADAGIVTSEFHGDLVIEDLRQYRQELTSDPAFRPHFHSLVDLGTVGYLDAPAADFSRFSETTPFSDQSRMAFVVGSDYSRGMARKFLFSLNKNDPDRARIFTDRAEALAWMREA